MKKIKRLRGPRRLLVASPRNSDCGSGSIRSLDFSRWFTDGARIEGGKYKTVFQATLYLHVYHQDRDLGTIHRVFCRHSKNPRLSLENGKLYWLIDR